MKLPFFICLFVCSSSTSFSYPTEESGHFDVDLFLNLPPGDLLHYSSSPRNDHKHHPHQNLLNDKPRQQSEPNQDHLKKVENDLETKRVKKQIANKKYRQRKRLANLGLLEWKDNRLKVNNETHSQQSIQSKKRKWEGMSEEERKAYKQRMLENERKSYSKRKQQRGYGKLYDVKMKVLRQKVREGNATELEEQKVLKEREAIRQRRKKAKEAKMVVKKVKRSKLPLLR